jgi:hypothetical protein
MPTDTPQLPIDDGLTAFIAQISARYERLARAAEASHADYLSSKGGLPRATLTHSTVVCEAAQTHAPRTPSLGPWAFPWRH